MHHKISRVSLLTFPELCSTLVWVLNSSSILQELSLTTIAIFAAISSEDVTKNHLKYHVLSMSILSACIGVTGVLNFEPDTCVFVAHELSPKYGIFFNSLRGLLVLTSVLSLFVTFYKDVCAKPKNPLLKSVSDLSDLSSKNSSGFECPQDRTWDPSSVSCTSSSTNSRACLRKRKIVDENNSHSTVYSLLFVCYICNHIPVLVIILDSSYVTFMYFYKFVYQPGPSYHFVTQLHAYRYTSNGVS